MMRAHKGHTGTVWRSTIETHFHAPDITVERQIGMVWDRIIVRLGGRTVSERKVSRQLGDIEQERTVERIKEHQREIDQAHRAAADDELIAWIKDHGEAGV